MGRLKHLQQGLRSFGHFPNTKIQKSNDVYGFGGAEYWWDASTGLNTSTNGALVSYWDDKISGARWSQATAGQQPSLKLVSAINTNYPSILQSGGTANLTGSFPIWRKTIAFVAKINSLQVANSIIGNSGSGNTIYMGGTSAAITGIGIYASVGQGAVVTTTVEDTNSHIVVITANAIIIDGVVQANGGTSNLTLAVTNLIGNPFSGNFGLAGELGELIIYNRTNLTNQQAIEICNNINAKWAIY